MEGGKRVERWGEGCRKEENREVGGGGNVIFGIKASLIQCSSRSCKSHWFLAFLLAEKLGETVKLRDCANHCTSHSGHTLCHLLNFRRELDLKNMKKEVDVYCNTHAVLGYYSEFECLDYKENLPNRIANHTTFSGL